MHFVCVCIFCVLCACVLPSPELCIALIIFFILCRVVWSSSRHCNAHAHTQIIFHQNTFQSSTDESALESSPTCQLTSYTPSGLHQLVFTSSINCHVCLCVIRTNFQSVAPIKHTPSLVLTTPGLSDVIDHVNAHALRCTLLGYR